MPNDKLREAQSFYLSEIRKVQQSPEHWQNFLNFAAQLQISDSQNDYEFATKLSIHAVNPNAKDCRQFGEWKSESGNHVNRYSKGIPVLTRDGNGNQAVRHLFDTSQTALNKEPERQSIAKMGITNERAEEILHNLIEQVSEKSNLSEQQKKIFRETAEFKLCKQYGMETSESPDRFSGIENLSVREIANIGIELNKCSRLFAAEIERSINNERSNHNSQSRNDRTEFHGRERSGMDLGRGDAAARSEISVQRGTESLVQDERERVDIRTSSRSPEAETDSSNGQVRKSASELHLADTLPDRDNNAERGHSEALRRNERGSTELDRADNRQKEADRGIHRDSEIGQISSEGTTNGEIQNGSGGRNTANDSLRNISGDKTADTEKVSAVSLGYERLKQAVLSDENVINTIKNFDEQNLQMTLDSVISKKAVEILLKNALENAPFYNDFAAENKTEQRESTEREIFEAALALKQELNKVSEKEEKLDTATQEKNSDIINQDTSKLTDNKFEKSISDNAKRSKNGDMIVGNTTFRFIPNKSYITVDKSVAEKVAQMLLDDGNLKFSSVFKDNSDTATFTVSKKYREQLENIIDSFKALEQEVESRQESDTIGTYAIYQLKDNSDLRDYRFASSAEVKDRGLEINAENYELVYSGELTSNDNAESIYAKFNVERPADFTGHSLSVSDIIVFDTDNGRTVNYVDSVGFMEVPDFFKEKVQETEISNGKETIKSQEVQQSGISVDDLKIGDYIRTDGEIWKITNIDGDFSLNLENIDKTALSTVRSIMGHWKENLQAEGFEYIPAKDIADILSDKETAERDNSETKTNLPLTRFTALTEEQEKFYQLHSYVYSPDTTPWGDVQSIYKINNGIYDVSTASHGGIMVKSDIGERIFSKEAKEHAFKENGFMCFEEDVASAFAYRELIDKGLFGDIDKFFREQYGSSYEEKIDDFNSAVNGTIQSFYPDYFEKREQAIFKALSPEKQAEETGQMMFGMEEFAENQAAVEAVTEIKPDSIEFTLGSTENDWLDDFKIDHENISFALGNALMEYLDEKQHTERDIPELNVGWYDKTDFTLKCVINGEEFGYEGRFDIGDGKGNGGGSLIDHIRQYNENALNNNPLHLSEEELTEKRKFLDTVVPFLESNSALTPEEQKIFENFKAENPIITKDMTLTDKEKAFLNGDILSFMSKSVLSWDEIESIGYRLYENGYNDKFAPHDKASYGNGLSETALHSLAHRMQDGEDISKELAKALLGNQRNFITTQNNEFTVEYGEDFAVARYGNSERQISYEDLGNAFFKLFRDKYNDIVHGRTVEDLRNILPDISDETADNLINAFDGAAMHGWNEEKLTNNAKINKIKRALYDILADEEKTEKAFASIADMKYNFKAEDKEEKHSLSNSAIITEEMYDIKNAKVHTFPKGDLAEIEILANEELLKRFADNGLSPKEITDKPIILDTDGKDWNKFIIPDKFGNKWNRIDAADILTSEEMSVMKSVVDKVIPDRSEIKINTEVETDTQIESSFDENAVKYAIGKIVHEHASDFTNATFAYLTHLQDYMIENEIDDIKSAVTSRDFYRHYGDVLLTSEYFSEDYTFTKDFPEEYNKYFKEYSERAEHNADISENIESVTVTQTDAEISKIHEVSGDFIPEEAFSAEVLNANGISNDINVKTIDFIGDRNGFETVKSAAHNESFGTTIADGDTLSIVINDNANVHDVRQLIETAQNNGVFLNKPSARFLESRFGADFMREESKPKKIDAHISSESEVSKQGKYGEWTVFTNKNSAGVEYGYIGRLKDITQERSGKNTEWCNDYFDNSVDGFGIDFALSIAEQLNESGITDLTAARDFVDRAVAEREKNLGLERDTSLLDVIECNVSKTNGVEHTAQEQKVSLMSDISEIKEASPEKQPEKETELVFSGDSESLNDIKDKALSLGRTVRSENKTISITAFSNEEIDEFKKLASEKRVTVTHSENEKASVNAMAKTYAVELAELENRMLAPDSPIITMIRNNPEISDESLRYYATNYFDNAAMGISDDSDFLNYYFNDEQNKEIIDNIFDKALAIVNGNERVNIKEQAEKTIRSENNTISITAFGNEEIDEFKKLASEKRVTMTHSEEKQTDNSTSDRNDSRFRITDEHLGEGGAKTKFRNNVEAIKTLKQLEQEERLPTPDEQEKLSKYVGWGGLQEAFDNRVESWKSEYQELKNLLTEEEYEAAISTVNDAFYTSPVISEAIYEALGNMGFDGGAVLEPSMGIGNFFGTMPDKMRDNSNLSGIEIDSISGRIAQMLYPEADIAINGYENININKNTYDLAVGNVPFGTTCPDDKTKAYKGLLIHDYFFAKSVDSVRSGGIIAFVTSKGTLDKEDTKVRQMLAQKAELLGAVRLPDNAFKKNAGTETTTDIIFLKKREKPLEISRMAADASCDWVHTKENADGFRINSYFADNPEMVLGKLETDYRGNTICKAIPDSDFKEQLHKAIENIKGEYTPVEFQSELDERNTDGYLPATPDIENLTYTVVEDKLYFRVDDSLVPLKEAEQHGKTAERRKAMCSLAETTRELLQAQVDDLPDEDIKRLQKKLNSEYDSFAKKYGRINAIEKETSTGVSKSSANSNAFKNDVRLPLLQSLEKMEEGQYVGKTEIFTERTIRPHKAVEHVETSHEALILSVSEKGRIDFDYMQELTGFEKDKIISDLKGDIYPVPELSSEGNTVYQTSDEYLSGNIYKKIAIAESLIAENPEYADNITALQEVIPTPLKATEIDIQLGATWLDPKLIQQFMYETFETPERFKEYSDSVAQDNPRAITVNYSGVGNGSWKIENTGFDNSVKTTKVFGTKDFNAYELLEKILNYKPVTVTETYKDDDGKKHTVILEKPTKAAEDKVKQIQAAFSKWIFKEPERRNELVKTYNERFNCIRPREYDGSSLNFYGSNPEISLKPHQKNAVAHALFGENTLFAHEVGAGKTFEMIATAMEGKRLGLHNKSMFVVPNHLTEQIGADFMKLYPNANILVAKQDDFSPQKRRRMCARIATGNFDAVIIGHSQLIKIPLSPEREKAFIKEQIAEITAGIVAAKEADGASYTIKDMEKTKAKLRERLNKLTNSTVKDSVVTFEELGIDKLFVDEAHEFKNLYVATKMENVSGLVTNGDVQKTEDLYMKCQYLDEKTNSKGVVFSTGTPVTNALSEMFTMQKYLQSRLLKEMGLDSFDAWAGNFTRKSTEAEISPSGKDWRMKTRLKFTNVPELVTAFKECADIKLADQLNLDVPECEKAVVSVEPTEHQKAIVDSLAERAEKIAKGTVSRAEDNMLCVTGDGRKTGLDQRLYDPQLPDEPQTKINTCINNVYDIWEKTAENRSTQLVFCDLGVPQSKEDIKKNGKRFSVYDEIKQKLIDKGIPEGEVAFIHEAKTETEKAKLFAKVRSGDVRILIGSTQKMGAGTNVQKKLIALHDLDCPWRPADLTQRLGRMVRQGNENKKVYNFRYVTKGTFDAYLYQMVEKKQLAISQIFTSKNINRTCDDIDDTALDCKQAKIAAIGDERIKKQMELRDEISNLKTLKNLYLDSRYEMEDRINAIPNEIKRTEKIIDGIAADTKIVQGYVPKRDIDGKEMFEMKIGNVLYTDKKEAAEALGKAMKTATFANTNKSTEIAEYKGFKITAAYDTFRKTFKGEIKGSNTYSFDFGMSDSGNLTRIDNTIASIPMRIDAACNRLESLNKELADCKEQLTVPFEHETELSEKEKELDRLTEEINADKLKGEIKPEQPESTQNVESVVSDNAEIIPENLQKVDKADMSESKNDVSENTGTVAKSTDNISQKEQAEENSDNQKPKNINIKWTQNGKEMKISYDKTDDKVTSYVGDKEVGNCSAKDLIITEAVGDFPKYITKCVMPLNLAFTDETAEHIKKFADKIQGKTIEKQTAKPTAPLFSKAKAMSDEFKPTSSKGQDNTQAHTQTQEQ